MKVKERIVETIKSLLPAVKEVQLSLAQKPEWGDFSSNVLVSSKAEEKVKKKVVNVLEKDELIEKAEVVGPGFLNIFLSQSGLEEIIEEILKEKEEFGKGERKPEKVQVEYISANPTGPFTLGNGRGAFGGECLARVYEFLGYPTEREYIINDLGRQIEILGDSIVLAKEGRPRKFKEEELYQGQYITTISKKVKIGKEASLLKIGQKAAEQIVKEHIKPSVKKLGISFDHWIKESSLYSQGRVEEALEELKKKGLIYEKENALWFKSAQFNDQKDRVVRRKNGDYTYFASDIGYAYDKFKIRKFDKVINLWGADHHGYLDRIKGMLKAFGWEKKWQVALFQLVKLYVKDFVNGKPVRITRRMSKRKGDYLILTDLTDKINPDVARFVFLSKEFDTPLDIDLTRLKEESKDNPVFYLQYAFARISSLERKKDQLKSEKEDKKEYSYNQQERELIMELSSFPETIRKISQNLEVHLLAFYTNRVAKRFHAFYRSSPILKTSPKIRDKRWQLVQATKYVLKNSLELMGISQPEKM